ncbi:hypothetical protein AUR66_14905 [Haloferax profundi]|uniref:Uncharacterized protein n=1 Tax=Haloferax profundi TaxID=1544718 RepID=A0A0W1SLP3_9EURY|nr:hypothetical protein AUR66_14905 [Haloferax profundi]
MTAQAKKLLVKVTHQRVAVLAQVTVLRVAHQCQRMGRLEMAEQVPKMELQNPLNQEKIQSNIL